MNLSRRICKIFVVFSSLVLHALIPSIVLVVSPTESVRIVARFQSPSTAGPPDLRNVAIDGASGVVYVGAVNIVYQLNGNLSLVGVAVTGPAWDNPGCYAPETFGNATWCSPGYGSTTSTVSQLPNYNQVYVMKY